MNRDHENPPAAFDPKLDIHWQAPELTFTYGEGVFGPEAEFRRLDDIRKSLRNPASKGPETVYSIVMDVGRYEHRDELARRMLLFGVVAYAPGQIGEEPVRSQGHTHTVAPHCGWSTPELFEIWEGRAIIYAQETANEDPGRCFAITAEPGDKVVVPPKWAHCVINADPRAPMVFGAWCDRQYGFVYDEIRARHGLAWFPIVDKSRSIRWEANLNYRSGQFATRGARAYPEIGLEPRMPIYQQFANDPDSVQWVAEPARFEKLWPEFEM